MVDMELLEAIRQVVREEVETVRKDIASLQAAVLGIGADLGRVEDKVEALIDVTKTNSFDIANLRSKVS